jgi:hypothetical protein
MTDDEQLLHAYARERSESAFGELVARHIDFVYSTALRVLNGDSHLAQDVAQTVFIDLARKAGSLPDDVALPGWLHRHTGPTAPAFRKCGLFYPPGNSSFSPLTYIIQQCISPL